jgi:hypothetical protein
MTRPSRRLGSVCSVCLVIALSVLVVESVVSASLATVAVGGILGWTTVSSLLSGGG